ncbi:MAG: NAD-dependent epimerase/dehydratase family protein [Elusimicrobia bacterium]|nr:NAD-dependent epimerase/dehydratase family protein [Elusimicrobiota bacterium]
MRVVDAVEVQEPDLQGKVEFFQGDIRDQALMARAAQGMRWVVHSAAALPISRAGREFYDVNVRGTRVVLEASQAAKVERVVDLSSSAVYLGKSLPVPIDENTELCPMGDYGESKLQAERVCEEFRARGLPVNILRSRTLVGSGRLGIFQILFDWISNGKRIYILGPGDNRYQLCSASDMAEAVWLAATVPGVLNEDFCIGAGEFRTVREDLGSLIAHAGTPSRLCSIPPWFARAALGTLDALRLSPLVDLHYKTPHKPFYFDIGKARRLLGYAPRQSNAQMLAEAYDWYLQNRASYSSRYGKTHRSALKQGLLKILHAVS